MVTVLGLSAGAAGAHDLWIQPSTFHPAPDEPVWVDLRIGHPGHGGEPVARDARHVERFVLHGPDGETAIPGIEGRRPAGWIRPPAPGRYVLVLRSREAVSVLPAQKFERHLREEGLEGVIARRAQRGESGEPGRERYSRALKALVTAGGPRTAAHGADENAWDRPLGLRLELVLPDDPAAVPPATPLDVELRFEGKPLAGALVEAHPLAGFGAGEEHPTPIAARTDERGRIAFEPTAAGAWLLTAVHMVRARDGVDEDWESVWAALTFAVGGN